MTTTKVNFAHAITYNTTKYKEQLTRFGQFSYASCQIEKLSLAELKSHYASNFHSAADISSKIATTTSGTTLFTLFKSAAISLTETPGSSRAYHVV